MRIDLHSHTRHSHDCLTSPSELILAAKRKGLDGIAITDHGTIRGGLEARDANRDPAFHVIVGAEIKTDAGDVIGLFLVDEIRSRQILEVIGEIHAQGGLALLPHPFRGRSAQEAVARAVDLIEAFNSRTSPDGNRQAGELARDVGKPGVSCSDAHFASDLGAHGVFESGADLRTALLRGPHSVKVVATPPYRMSASQIVKACKSGRYGQIPLHAARLVKRLVSSR